MPRRARWRSPEVAGLPLPRPPTLGGVQELDAAELLSIYDEQVRAHVSSALPAGATVERDGPLVRIVGQDQRGFVTYPDLGGVTGAALDALIAAQRDFFAARGEGVEWKLHAHDVPPDLPERLKAAGFSAEDEETVVVGLAGPLAAASQQDLPGVRLREVTARADLERIMRMEWEVWGRDRMWQAEALELEIAADPDSITVVVAEAGDAIVCAGWVRYLEGTDFATLWGGATHPAWRKRGIYRALLAYRARLAVARGRTYLQVDASEDSRPILQRLGFVALTTTTPYVWEPKEHPLSLSDEEKTTVRNAAFGAVYLVSNADPGVLAMIKESFAASAALARTPGPVGELLTHGGLPSVPKVAPAELAERVLPELTQAITLLREKEPAELAAFRTAVTEACDKVAEASKGVSDAEAAVLGKIKAILADGGGE
jgi:GNAT superfamily N-acetyltransferase